MRRSSWPITFADTFIKTNSGSPKSFQLVPTSLRVTPNIQARLRCLNQASQLGRQLMSADLVVRIALLRQLPPDFTDRDRFPRLGKLKGAF